MNTGHILMLAIIVLYDWYVTLCRLHLLACFFGLLSSIDCVACLNSKPNFSSRLHGQSFKLIADVSFKKCSEECELRQKCVSINYNNKRHLCELNSEKQGAGFPLTTARGWHYVSMMDQSEMDDTKPCSENICEDTETCINDTCVKTECFPTQHIVANGYVLGNMNEIGSKMVIKCDRGHRMDGEVCVLCQSDGMWSEVPVCVYNMDCPVGKRYDFDSSSCTDICTNGYADTFRLFVNHVCPGFDFRVIYTQSLESCQRSCIQTALCTAADHDSIRQVCAIQTNDTTSCIRSAKGWQYSLRDCA